MNTKKSLQIELKLSPNQTALAQKFPSINFTSTSRALMSLSRRDRYEGQVELNFVSNSKQIQPQREQIQLLKATNSTSGSAAKFRQPQKQQTKLLKTLNFVRKYDKQKILPPTSLAKLPKQHSYQLQKLQKNESPSKMPIKQETNSLFSGQVKFCDRKFGRVDGYAISSHVGSLCATNNTRICVATNLLQNSNRLREVSFFGLFQGRNGSNRAEYMREYFHNTLINDELFYYNFQKAVSRTFQKLQRDFNYDPRYDGDYSIVTSVICIIQGTKMYLIRSGAPNATISTKLGSYIKTLSTEQKPQPNPHPQKTHSSLSHYNSKSILPKEEVHIRILELSSEYDFVILGNEGLYLLANSKGELGAQVWRHLLEDLGAGGRTAGNRLAKVCNRICEDAVKRDNLGRCMSMILIQFQNLTSCFKQPPELLLPHTHSHPRLSKQYSENMQKELSINLNMNETNYQQNESPLRQKFALSPRYMRTFSNLI